MDVSGLPIANVAHWRKLERMVWAAAGGYVATYAMLEHLVAAQVPRRWQRAARIGAVALSSAVTTAGINKAAFSRTAGFYRERDTNREALRRGGERLRAVVESAPVVLFATDADGVLTLWEGRARAVLSAWPAQVVGRSVFEVFRDVPQICENVRRALAGESFDATLEIDARTFEAHYEPMRDLDGDVIGMVGVATDSTERAKREAADRERIRLDAALLVVRTVTHEINNALAPVTGFAELLAADLASGRGSQATVYAKLIVEGAADVARKVRRLQGIVRLEETAAPLGASRPLLDMDRSTTL